MAERINISVPDELHAQLQKWREQINVSAICQQALRKEIARLEVIPGEIEDLDAVVQRLRAEKEEYERYWHQIGVQFGMQWARLASYGSLSVWAQPGRRSPPHDAVKYVLGEYLADDPDAVFDSDKLDRYPALKEIFVVDEDWGPVRTHYDREALSRGWLDGVGQFWNQIKDAL